MSKRLTGAVISKELMICMMVVLMVHFISGFEVKRYIETLTRRNPELIRSYLILTVSHAAVPFQ